MIARFLPTLAAILCCSCAVWAAPALEIVPLQHRLADEMAPLIRPLLAPGDVLVPNRTQLILQTSPERLTQIKQLLQTLDRSPHRLLISVRQSSNLSREELDASAQAQGNIPWNRPDQASLTLHGHFNQTGSDDDRNSLQQIQAIEGAPAQIQFGESRPTVTTVMTTAYGRRVIATQGMGYQDLTTGFSVVARLTGNGEVVLQVQPWSNRPDPLNKNLLRNQQASTALQGKTGEWLVIGSQNNGQTANQTQWLGHHYSTGKENAALLIKVDDLDAGKESPGSD